MNNGAFGENFPYTNFHDLNLDWVLKTLKEIKEQIDADEISLEEIEQRLATIEDWIENYSSDYAKEIVEKYIRENLASMIFVEISNAGYFVYHIPQNWKSIVFNTTGLDIFIDCQPQYGHLVLSY